MGFIKSETSAEEEGYLYIFRSHSVLSCEKIWVLTLKSLSHLPLKFLTKARNLIFNAIFRPLPKDIKVIERFCKDIFSKKQNIKHMMFAGDFNMNVLDYEYTVMVSCSIFIWITNSSDHRSVWTSNLLHTK